MPCRRRSCAPNSPPCRRTSCKAGSMRWKPGAGRPARRRRRCPGGMSALRQLMAQQDADTNIHTAAADRQAAVATASHTLEEALLLHTAAAMLDLALKSVEETGDFRPAAADRRDFPGADAGCLYARHQRNRRRQRRAPGAAAAGVPGGAAECRSALRGHARPAVPGAARRRDRAPPDQRDAAAVHRRRHPADLRRRAGAWRRCGCCANSAEQTQVILLTHHRARAGPVGAAAGGQRACVRARGGAEFGLMRRGASSCGGDLVRCLPVGDRVVAGG